MKFLKSVLLVAVCAFACESQAATVIFQDNFKGVTTTLPGKGTKLYPDQSKWAFTFWPGIEWPTSYGDGTNWLSGNGECQDYVTPLLTSISGTSIPAQYRYDPFYIESDGLHIRASLLSTAQQAAYKIGSFRRFGSGMLMSRFNFTYGDIKVVAKMPPGLGSWPAIWLLASNNQWPPEMDILEGMPWKQHLEQIHSGMLLPQGLATSVAGWFNVGVDLTKAFHTYELNWTAETMTMLFDGKQQWQVPTPASMNQNFYLIINLAVGGTWVFDELNVSPIGSSSASRLSQGSNLIQSGYPTDMVIKSVTITQP